MKYKLVKESKEKIISSGKEIFEFIRNSKTCKKILFRVGVVILCAAMIISLLKLDLYYNADYYTVPYTIIEVVDSGENLTIIAQKYGTTIDEIAKDNNLSDPNKLQVGQQLKINCEIKVQDYIVKAGDTLTKIAQENKTTVEIITQLNSLSNPDQIEIGQKLVVPFHKKQQAETKKLDLDEWDQKLEQNGYVQGIDLSYAQETMDLDLVLKKNDMIDFVIARSFYFWGGREVDRTFDNFSEIAYNNGVSVGTYFWPTLKSIESTKEELDIVINQLKKNQEKGIYYTMPICMDIEKSEDGGGDLTSRIQTGDLETIKCFEFAVNYLRQNGYEVMVYTGASTARDCGVRDLAEKYGVELWLSGGSYYKSNLSITDDPKIYADPLRQLTGVGRQYCEGIVSGYNDNIDLNIWYENTPRKIIDKSYNNTDEMPKKLIKR